MCRTYTSEDVTSVTDRGRILFPGADDVEVRVKWPGIMRGSEEANE